MYIIELICKIKEKIEKGEFHFPKKAAPKDDPIKTAECEHIFVPVDSTKTVLACTKCGHMVRVKNKEVKNENPFQ